MSTLRAMARRDMVSICIVIFIADVVWSILSPTFSIFAQSIGATLVFIGVLNSVTGFTQFVASVPVGIRSDVWGRRAVIATGAAILAVACALHASAVVPWMLILARVLFALGTVMVFPTSTVLTADVTQPHERGVAFGLITTVMSFGATIGAFFAAWLEPRVGISGSYWVATALAAVCCLSAWLLLPAGKSRKSSAGNRAMSLAGMLPLLKRPTIAFVTLLNFCMSTCFSGVIMAFFPLLAVERGATSAQVSSFFSFRAIGSMFTRLPIGMVSARLPRGAMLAVALAAVSLLLIAMSAASAVAVLATLLVLEGVAFGTNLTVGQAFVAEQVTEQERATAIGIYNTAGSLGATLSPLMLGALANAAGVSTVFVAVGALSLVALAFGALRLRNARRAVAGSPAA